MVYYRSIALLFLVAALASSSFPLDAASFAELFSEDFSTASSLDEWSVDSSAGGSVIWNGADGSPAPGSLALTVMPGEVVSVVSPCFSFDPSQRWALSVQAKSVQASASLCAFEHQTYATPDCSGVPTFFGLFAGTGTPGDWTSEIHDILIPEDVPVPGVQTLGMRLRFEHGNGVGASSCLFDDLRVRGMAAAIPTLGHLGLGTLALGLGTIAIWFLAVRR